MKDSLIDKSSSQLKKLYAAKEVKVIEVLDAHIAQIDRLENKVNAFLTLTFDKARQEAKILDEKLVRGEDLGILGGIPVALKDNLCVAGTPTTCASKILKDFTPAYESQAVRSLRKEGALFVGKTNLDEFAMGSSTENSGIKPTANPHNLAYVPGGSSGGSAASVAAGFAVCALGSDTGGSIRQPASFCGVVGMKPTYGLVSRFGLVAFASSLDQIGPFARTSYDAALTLLAMQGHDPKDSTSLKDPYGPQFNPKGFPALSQEFLTAMVAKSPEQIYKGVRIGVIRELMGDGIDQDIKQAITKAIAELTKLGALVEEVSLPNAKYALAVYYILATAEASANLARFDGVRYGLRNEEAQDLINMYMSTRHDGFGAEVKRRIMLGTYALSSGYYDAYYKKAQQVRRLVSEDFQKAFNSFDVLLSPTSPIPAFKFGDKTEEPLQMYLSDIATIPANLAGIPGISLPCALDSHDMPIGLQLLAPQLSDAKLLEFAHGFEMNLKTCFLAPCMPKTQEVS
jgi:aspartyl-tRNA(Asn)/glutamyl-tRNA(Gln) amidotransferase subunit A